MEYKEVDGRKFLILKRDWKNHPKNERLPPRVWCPFCNGEHSHSLDEGHRVSHCMPPTQNVIASDGSVLSSNDGYWIIDINKH